MCSSWYQGRLASWVTSICNYAAVLALKGRMFQSQGLPCLEGRCCALWVPASLTPPTVDTTLRARWSEAYVTVFIEHFLRAGLCQVLG